MIRQLTTITFLFLFLDWPVVQVMRNIMALTAFREALVHTLSVRFTMAVSTCRHSHVLGGVTGCTGNLAVFGCACNKCRIDRIVASSTEL